MNRMLLEAPCRGCLPQPTRITAGSCVSFKYQDVGERLSPALLKWVSVKSALIKPQALRWNHRRSHIFGLTITTVASELSSTKEAQRCLSALAASLSSASPEEDSTARSSERLGLNIDLNLPRRRLQLSFTCDACGARTQRLINPNAYARGTVFVQCAGCEVYHKLVDNLGLIEEYDFRKDEEREADGADLNVPQ